MWLSSIGGNMQEIIHQVWYADEEKCVLCGTPGASLCPSCASANFYPQYGRCHSCGKLIAAGQESCQDCLKGNGPRRLSQVAAWGHYSGAWKDFIWTVKFKAQPRRLLAIGNNFAQWAIDNLPIPDGVVAVPMHLERRAERGFNQADVLASLLQWHLGLPIFYGLARALPTVPQVSLKRAERLHNLEDAFIVDVRAPIEGRSLWLVDDVTTTGSTLDACAKALKEAGADTVYGLCLAAGMEKGLVAPPD